MNIDEIVLKPLQQASQELIVREHLRTVAPVQVTILEGATFCISDELGDIGEPTTGFFEEDTRFLSRFALRINGARPLLLSVGQGRLLLGSLVPAEPARRRARPRRGLDRAPQVRGRGHAGSHHPRQPLRASRRARARARARDGLRRHLRRQGIRPGPRGSRARNAAGPGDAGLRRGREPAPLQLERQLRRENPGPPVRIGRGRGRAGSLPAHAWSA